MARSPRSDFAHFYVTTLLSELKSLEAVRKTVARRLCVLFISTASVFMLSVVVDLAGEGPGSMPFMVAVFSVPVVTFAYRFLVSGYVHAFKVNIIGRIVTYMDPDLTYCPRGHVPKWQVVASRIFSRHPDRVTGDDLVEGRIVATNMQFSEVHAEAKHESRFSTSGGRRKWSTIFRGLFFVADFNKKLRGKTLILPDTAERVLGGVGTFLQSLNAERGELMTMDDPEFEKHFVVYGDDQVEARYVLSTSLMGRIVEFRKRTGRRVCLSFVGSHVYVAIPYQRRLFEPRVFRSILGFEGVEAYFEDFQLFLGIVGDLDLNTRIWTKREEEPLSPMARFFMSSRPD